MKCSQVPFLPLGIGAVFVSAITFSLYGQVHQGDQNRRERFRVQGASTDEGSAGSFERSGRKAYLHEMGITSPLFPEENTSSDVDVAPYDPVPDPEDDGVDVVALANFMRSTKAPARAEIVSDGAAGEQRFNGIGCAVCHVPAITTARPGPRSTAASSPCRLLSGTKSSIPIVIFSCTISARATASQSCLNLPRRRIKSALPRFGRSAREIG